MDNQEPFSQSPITEESLEQNNNAKTEPSPSPKPKKKFIILGIVIIALLLVPEVVLPRINI